MAQIICIRLDWNHTAIPLRMASSYYTLHYGPEPAHPFGRRAWPWLRRFPAELPARYC